MTSDSLLPFGIYETPVTARIHERIKETQRALPTAASGITEVTTKDVDPRFATAVSQHFARLIEQRLLEVKKPEERVALINDLAQHLGADEKVSAEQLLYAIYSSELTEPPVLPEVSLNSSALFTNSVDDTNMSVEIAREICTADSVDLLCAFIKNSGISVISDELEYLRDHKKPLRVITSTYCGATEAAAVRRLVEDYNAEVRICYEHKTTRLHAKAWLFRRESGFDTAFIGSSNLSRSALVDGWEWNVRGSRSTTPEIIEKFIKTFDSYWFDNHFKHFDPERDYERLLEALRGAKFLEAKEGEKLELSGLRVEPYPYQQEMLEALRSERAVHGRHKNLLIAATGTGKTVVAALDYRHLCDEFGRRPRLLFVAHRREILQQAQRTYREVLQSSDFGELLVGGEEPRRWDHVFASIQSLHGERLTRIAPDHFDVIVIDEFHHAEATTYRKILDYFQPQELLGLTATPERGDGENVQKFFDYRVAHELRLWDALRLQLLAPLHYYGVDDDTDLSSLTWNRGKKDYNTTELSEFYIKAGEKRTRFIINELNRRIFDLSEMKALGFCVSIAHAEYMAEQFNAFGIPALAVSSKQSTEERRRAIAQLRDGYIKIIFAVDIFNEGVDIPSINTLLLLRPTQSPVLFVQQLGRGLRLNQGKDACIVFDFLGLQHEEFDFEERFKVLTAARGKSFMKEVEQGFPTAPPGSNITLDRVTTDRVLANVKRLARNTVKKIRSQISEHGTTDLAAFIHASNIPLEDIYRRKGISWTTLLRDEKLLLPSNEDSEESFLLSRIRVLLHINDPGRVAAYSRLMEADGPSEQDMTDREKRYATMLVLALWANSNKAIPGSLDEALEIVRSHPAFVNEVNQVMRIAIEASRVIPQQSSHSVLETHADYSLAELVGALDEGPLKKLANLPREGVKRFDTSNTDLFLVTFQKDENVSASTNYRDYPLSPDRLHWESQSTTTLKSAMAKRYIHHQELGGSIIIATRFTKKNKVDTAAAYTFLGNVDYVTHRGEKPIQFEWSLRRDMPKKLYAAGRTVA
ncbi:DUF3427 domain-containing protein [Corynebacterium sp. HMSC078H07]|uniref:DUF3427 domain-containing protein n=1 Tax=Corynebacterium sp. HMSC078H07 TaxID=1739379 RepID=UPI0008A24F91|nr:DUF3427 domain-containing protein [Corynebacterium sp. HMSC078H07]OFR67020.1 helicase [Corynebacterium sp. HMSC078H07]